MGEPDELEHARLVLGGEQVILHWVPEEGRDVVPVFFEGVLGCRAVGFPVDLQLLREDCEVLVVGVLLDRGPSLEAVHDQLQAYLSVLHADCHVLLEELGKGLSAHLPPLLVQPQHQFLDLVLIEAQEVSIGRVKEPILAAFASLEGD